MHAYTSIILCTFSVVVASGQPVHDRDYQFFTNEHCSIKDSTAEIFRKVEKDPEVLSLSQAEFVAQLRETIEKVFFEEVNSGHLKLKIWFPADSGSCWKSIGFSGIQELDSGTTESFLASLPSIGDFAPGLQRLQPLNCEGLVFITLSEGTMYSYRIANFTFRKS